MKIFLICPVRGVTPEQQGQIKAYVAELEKHNEVYWPYRDTDQADTNGTAICAANRTAILDADEIHVWYSPESQGSLFDLGIAWGAKKKLVLVNEVQSTPHKSFGNVVRKWAQV